MKKNSLPLRSVLVDMEVEYSVAVLTLMLNTVVLDTSVVKVYEVEVPVLSEVDRLVLVERTATVAVVVYPYAGLYTID